MKAAMLSMRQKWCDLIASGEKTVEVRKNRPKMDTPFKCYLYEALGKPHYIDIPIPADQGGGELRDLIRCGGKVIGEFVCTGIRTIGFEYGGIKEDLERSLAGSCLSNSEAREYFKNKRNRKKDPCLYGWHISAVKIYDNPKDLCEFNRIYLDEYSIIHTFPVARPPQSWCYVEEKSC